MFKRSWFAVLAAVALLLASCSSNVVAPAQVRQTRALVESVDVVQVIGTQGSGRHSLMALVRGALPDSCARLGEPVVSPGGQFVVVILPQVRVENGKDCAPGPLAYERTVALGPDMAPGQYTVSVNGVQTVFDLQGEPVSAPLAAQADPTPSPTVEGPAPAAQLAAEGQITESDALNIDPTPLPAAQPVAVSAAPQPAAGPTLVPLTSGACEDKAAFFADVSVPDGTLFEPGEKFTKTWRIRNVGTCTWQGYGLAFQQGDRLGSPDPAPITETVEPGEVVEISLELTAPQAPGSYFSDWLFLNSQGSTFGLGNPPIGLLWTKVGVAAPVPPGGSAPACAYRSDPTVEAEILALINQARAERGLKPLKLVDALSTAARLHSEDMGCGDYVNHYSPDGSNWFKRIQAQGIKYRDASENIYAGNPTFGGTAQGAFNWWMNSQIHRDNILNPKSEQIGIGYAYAESSEYKGYYTLNFVQP